LKPSEQPYRRFWAFFLMSAFLLPLVASEVHVLLDHQELKEKCLASKGDPHLHDGSGFEYHCLFCCNKPSEFADPAQTETLQVFPAEKNRQPSFSASYHTFQPFYSIAQRAPPAGA
jgi:hypothetical protein